MDRFWDLLERSVLITGIIALAFVGTACYMALAGNPVPDWLLHGLWIVLGLFFGGKMQSSVNKRT